MCTARRLGVGSKGNIVAVDVLPVGFALWNLQYCPSWNILYFDRIVPFSMGYG